MKSANDWKELSEAAAREQDPEKLLQLVEQLNQVLEDREEELKRQQAPPQQLSRSASTAFVAA